MFSTLFYSNAIIWSKSKSSFAHTFDFTLNVLGNKIFFTEMCERKRHPRNQPVKLKAISRIFANFAVKFD